MIKVLVIGEHCLDYFIYCEANRLCPEAPVPVLIQKETKSNMGMAANVANNIRSLEDNLDVTEWTQKKLISKTRYIDIKTNHMFLRVDKGEDGIEPFKLDTEKVDKIKESDIVIVSDYDKGFLTLDIIKTIGKLSKLSILDSKKKLTPDVIDSFTFVKLNEFEAKYNNIEFSDKVLITLGSKGCSYKGKIYPSPNPQQTIDVSGAGDTFTASFILRFFYTKNPIKSIEFANEMASLVVSKRGVVTP